jgi:hypothetical protein
MRRLKEHENGDIACFLREMKVLEKEVEEK